MTTKTLKQQFPFLDELVQNDIEIYLTGSENNMLTFKAGEKTLEIQLEKQYTVLSETEYVLSAVRVNDKLTLSISFTNLLEHDGGDSFLYNNTLDLATPLPNEGLDKSILNFMNKVFKAEKEYRKENPNGTECKIYRFKRT